MPDLADRAEEQIEAERERALRVRKPAPTMCQDCGERPCAILPNGARARYCFECLPTAIGAPR
jgi:hypothetical protein